MKITNNNSATSRSRFKTFKRFNFALESLVLTSLLSLGASLTLANLAIAHPEASSPLGNSELLQGNSNSSNQIIAQARRPNTSRNRLPQSVINAVRQDLSRRTGISSRSLRLTNSSRRTWPNGCLGLESPTENCIQILIEGWRIVMSNGRQSWVYRTDNTGRTIALETQNASSNLPQSVRNAVLQNASVRSGLPISRLRVESAQQTSWPDGCLGIHEPGIGCTLGAVPGWQVTVTDGLQRWVYRTDKSGSSIRLDVAASNVGNPNSYLPQSVRNAVLQNASERSGLPSSRLRIESAQRRTWSDGCLGLGGPNESCLMAVVPGWQVTVTDGLERWVYRTDESGSAIRLDVAASNGGNPNSELPESVRNVALQDASERSRLPISRLSIESAQQRTWSGGCLGLGGPNEACTRELVFGWQITVTDGSQRWVYRTDGSGSKIRLDVAASDIGNPNSEIPQSVRNAVLQNASERTGLPNSRLTIESAQRRTWSDSCLGLGGINELCATTLVPGWQVTVTGGSQRLVYRTNESGSVVQLDRAASDVGEVNESMLFRATSSGGIAGRTYETTLFPDGRVVRILVSPNQNASSEARIHRISTQQLERFQALLTRFPLSQFDGQDYPAPSGAADHITVTLTSNSGTVRYVDFAQSSLPQPLQEIVRAWNEIATPRQF